MDAKSDREHREKRHKSEKDRESDKHEERERKRSRRDKDAKKTPERHDSNNKSERSERRSPRADSPPSRAEAATRPAGDEAGGEVSLSIEETNRLRVSLGLKPLSVGNSDSAAAAASAAVAKKRAEEEKKAKEAELAERVKAQREKRLEQENLRKVKTLGEAGEDVDDLGAWVSRSRAAEAKQKEAEKAKAAKLAKQLDEQDGVDEEEDDEEAAVSNAKELAGMRVKHSAEELNEGETMILTLADRSILDDKGQIDEDAEELENALVTEDKMRKKAFKAATKENKPLFGEDGKVRGLLDKYDEEAEEEGMSIDEAGAIARAKKQEEIRAKLREAESAATASGPSFATGNDYFTKEEMEQFQKPKTKKKRKLRKKAADEGGLDLAALAAEAAANDSGVDRGSRAQRALRDAEKAEAEAAELRKRRERYENALDKANIASLALRQQGTSREEASYEDEADEDLQASLARAQRAVQVKAETLTPEEVAAAAARRRQDREQAEAEQAGGLEFSEAKDFANSIQLVEAEPSAPAEATAAEPAPMEVEEPLPPPPAMPPPPPRPQPAASNGGWVSAEQVKEEPKGEEMRLPPPPAIKQESKEESLVREKTVGTGLAGAMALLRERGELQQKVEWAGRTNDMKKEKLQGLDDVYQGGSHEDKIAADIEQALTERDEFGRVLTPKERFRRLCHNFHGKTISKTKQEKRLRKMQEELDARRAATAEGSGAAFSRIGGQHVAGTPYTVLSGKLQPGQSSDPASGLASVAHQVPPTPVPGGQTPRLGGGVTPLVGDSKVELMLGLRREGEKSVSVRKG